MPSVFFYSPRDAMTNTMKMNNFLQRMLKKSEDETEGEKVIPENTKFEIENYPRTNKSTSWMKKIGSCSPSSKREFTSSLKSPSRPITLNVGEYRNDYRRKNTADPMAPKSITDSEETPNLERIRREFEMGFLSPTKQESADIKKSGRFVKKIVAAFEEKYKPFNDGKMEVKKSSIESESSEDSSYEQDINVSDRMEESSAMLDNTCVVESLESRLSRYLDSYIATSSVRDEESRSTEEINLDLDECFFAMDEEMRLSSENASLENEKTIGSIDTDFTQEDNDNSTSPSVNLVRRNSSIRGPKIVGAYLKKPIEVEDTSIDWIPITGKKLPRKRSFKRLLSILTRKKSSAKSSKLYCSEMNLQEETTKELLQDSGYDEKSGSSSSLTSLVSINDLLLQEKNRYSDIFEDDRRVYCMTTFRQTPTVEDDGFNDNDFLNGDSSSMYDDVSDSCSFSSKKLLLEEVSRSELRLSLGPAFPSAAAAKFICSLDRREAKPATTKSIKNDSTTMKVIAPLAPPLPKHPFVSLKEKSCKNQENSNLLSKETKNKGNLSFPEIDKIGSENIFQTWTFPTGEITYDTPRRYLSKSDPGLASIGKQGKINDSTIENVYDVPKPKLPRRPRSSIYDDALSLKRRNDHFSNCSPAFPSEFYGFPGNQEPHYATVKPRNTRINPSRELLRSVGDLSLKDRNCTDYYYGWMVDRFGN